MQYVYPIAKARTINKHGVDITLYDAADPNSSVVYEHVEHGHLEEFYSDISTYTWFIIEGEGTFVIDDEKLVVGAKDLVVVPPKKRIHYFGTMKMILSVTPAFNEAYEHHVRDVSLSESPYAHD